MSGATRNKLGAVTLVLIVLAFVVAAVATNVWLRGVRVDLTENNLYTLGDGTQAVLDGIEEPINLYLFFSNEATETLPTLRAYATRVREMLEELAANAPDGKLVLNVVDPLPFSEEEDRAEQLGLQAVDVGTGGDPVYFGLAGTNSVGTTDRIPFFQPDPRKEAFLEYDLARLDLQPREHRQDSRRPADERADRRRLRSADAAAVAAVGRRRASQAAARGADAAGERAHDRRRHRRALDRASRDARRLARSTPSISSSCAAAAR